MLIGSAPWIRLLLCESVAEGKPGVCAFWNRPPVPRGVASSHRDRFLAELVI